MALSYRVAAARLASAAAANISRRRDMLNAASKVFMRRKPTLTEICEMLHRSPQWEAHLYAFSRTPWRSCGPRAGSARFASLPSSPGSPRTRSRALSRRGRRPGPASGRPLFGGQTRSPAAAQKTPSDAPRCYEATAQILGTADACWRNASRADADNKRGSAPAPNPERRVSDNAAARLQRLGRCSGESAQSIDLIRCARVFTKSCQSRASATR